MFFCLGLVLFGYVCSRACLLSCLLLARLVFCSFVFYVFLSIFVFVFRWARLDSGLGDPPIQQQKCLGHCESRGHANSKSVWEIVGAEAMPTAKVSGTL